MIRTLIALFSIVLFLNFSYEKPRDNRPDFLQDQNKWVDSVFNALTPDERITQLFMIAAYSNKDLKHVRETREIIQKYNVGGLIMMQGGPLRHTKLVNYYQDKARTPLLLSIDGEWGLAMRLDSTPRYPKQMALGAIQNDSLIYFMGKQIAKECKRVGLHVNFAPVVDVNNNPANPVIGIRSFGEDKDKVAVKGYMYMKGMQDEHVMANAKHFPGHGDTDVDSHKGLPLINHPRQRLDSLELYPFKYLFERGLASIMVAHLNIPSLDTTKNLASTLSPKIVTDLLKNELGFQGLIFTDALNMKGASAFFTPGVIDVKALQAGNDVLLFLEDVPKALEAIKKAIADSTLKQEDIDLRCKKILKAKYWCGLNNKQHIAIKNIYEELNTRESDALNTKLAEASMTLLKNDKHLLPLKSLDSLKIASVSLGLEDENTFHKSIANYGPIKHFGLAHDAKKREVDSLFSKLKDYNLVIIQLNKSTLKPDKNYGVSNQSLMIIDSISSMKRTIGVFFNNPYVMNALKTPSRLESILMAYEYTVFTQKAAADAIFGAIKVNGRLPVSTKYFKLHSGLENDEIIRLKFVNPQSMGVQKKNLEIIDSIANLGIKEHAYPGCQVVAIKDGKLFFRKSYGHQTYDTTSPKINDETIYDLASITKISSSCLALMGLKSVGKFDYRQTLGSYLPEVANSNKNDLSIEEVLTHQAGLAAWIPFYLRTIDKQGNYKSGLYNDKRSDDYPVQVAKNLYTTTWMADTMFSRILASKIENKGKYLYSDLGYYFMQRIIEKQSGQAQQDYVADKFYRPMGLGLTYRPLEKYKLNEIAPTENDKKFRKQIVQGYVHDPGAAMLGGVAGHAGLFGTAKDLAVLMQMYLDKGNYGGIQYLDSNVVKEFTACRFCPTNRRGLCFDKPEPDPKKDSPVTELASPESYGHSGFTGTFTWVDPKNKLIVVFLSNRVYPDAEENKLAKLGIRGKIHRAFYDAVQNTEKFLYQ
jgi:beta-glucosidase-like glycosyl hydrolase/CubicO group peptidase (beta-lactamase class C family)